MILPAELSDAMRDRIMILMSLAPPYLPCDRLQRALMACLVGVVCMVSVPSAAQESSPHNPPPAAIDGYNRGRALYQAGRYREAVVELERALSLDPTSPNLVYNVARVHELLGDLDKATAFYERYRTMLPASEVAERERVDSILLRLEGARTQVKPVPAGPPTDSLRNPQLVRPAPPVVRRGVADGVFWTTATLGAAALIVGGTTGVFALRTQKRVEDFTVGPDGSLKAHDQLAERADRLALSSDVLLMVGTTFAVSSILLYTLREEAVSSERAGRPRLGVSASGQGFAFTLRGTL